VRSPSPFAATHWSVVLAAGRPDDPGSLAALEVLCRAYWSPVYGHVRRCGFSPHDAQDLTQGFFARLLEKNPLADVDRGKGKFRSFLLASLDHYIANQRRSAHAQKRGGEYAFVSLDESEAERMFLRTPGSAFSPEQSFDFQWATTLLGRVLMRLQCECESAGKGGLFDALKVYLTGDPEDLTYAALSRRLGMTEGALKMAVSRMRRRYGELLRSEIGATVARPEDVQGELETLMAVLRL
jgi:DNA-directed RNA polymerase specialized sigma24 family protein